MKNSRKSQNEIFRASFVIKHGNPGKLTPFSVKNVADYSILDETYKADTKKA